MSHALPRGDAGDLKAWQGLILIGGILLVSLLPPALRVWPFPLLLPLALYGLLVLAFPPLRGGITWLRPGRCDARLVAATAILIVLSSAALVAFQVLVQPDLAEFLSVLPVSAAQGFSLVAVSFCLLNAILEEVAFRGILFDAIEARWGRAGAIVGSAIAFGFAHIVGYPSGAIGVLMATAYALALGALRHLSGGLPLCIAAHLFADLTIVAILARWGAP